MPISKCFKCGLAVSNVFDDFETGHYRYIHLAKFEDCLVPAIEVRQANDRHSNGPGATESQHENGGTEDSEPDADESDRLLREESRPLDECGA